MQNTNKDIVDKFFREYKSEEEKESFPGFDEFIDSVVGDIEKNISDIETILDDEFLDSITNVKDADVHVIPGGKNRYWLTGIAAVISLIAIFQIFFTEKETRKEIELILDTSNSPTVTNALSEPEQEEFLDWEAPSDYLSDDFN